MPILLTIRRHADGNGWEWLGEARAIERIRVGRKVIEVIEALGGSATVDDLTTYLELSRQAVSSQLKNGERDGYLMRLSGSVEGSKGGRPKDLWVVKNAESVGGVNQAIMSGGGTPNIY